MTRYRIFQHGASVAEVSGPCDLQSLSQAMHYAVQYVDEGSLQIQRKAYRQTKWHTVADLKVADQ